VRNFLGLARSVHTHRQGAISSEAIRYSTLVDIYTSVELLPFQMVKGHTEETLPCWFPGAKPSLEDEQCVPRDKFHFALTSGFLYYFDKRKCETATSGTASSSSKLSTRTPSDRISHPTAVPVKVAGASP
jgi:hypothetical protein